MLHLDALFGSDGIGLANQLFVVGLAHVREAGAVGDVLSAQGMFGEVVDMVGDDHQVTDLKRGVGAATGVGDEEGLDAQLAHHADGVGDLFHRVTFVVVEAALHGHDLFVAQLAEDELATVAFNGGDGEVGDILVVDFILLGNFAGQATESGAEDDGRFGMGVHARLKIGGRFLNSF